MTATATEYAIAPEATFEQRVKLKDKSEDKREPGLLILRCEICRAKRVINAHDRTISTLQALHDGWMRDGRGRQICPSCPK